MANESPNAFFTQAAWAAMWNPSSDYYLPNVIKNGINKAGVQMDPMGNLTVGSVPPSGSIQLMESHDLASWLPVKTGYVGVVFNNVLATNLSAITNGGLTYTDVSDSQGKMTAVINVPQIQITGGYTLVATGLAQCALDSAAILPGGLKTGLLKANGDDVTNDDRLEAARAQRTKLWQTPNGGQFMDMFYDHNEVYNYAFQNNAGLKNSWSQPVNQNYMNTTYTASQNPSSQVVNPQQTGLGSSDDPGYNVNAFNQKLAVAYAAYGYSQNPPAGSNITSAQFLEAGKAALQFEGVVNETGNTSNNTVPMTVDQVYGTISAGSPGTAMKLRAMREQVPASFDEFMNSLSENDKAYLARMEQEASALMVGSSNASATLMTGTFHVVINGGTLTLGADLTFTTSPTLKATANVTSFTSALNIASVAIDNQPSWLGLKSIGQAVIDSYNSSGQIASLMQDKANDELESDTVKDYISTWLNNTLQQLLGNFQ